MITPEILSQLTAKTCRYSIDISDEPIRQDIILSMQGIDPGKTAFMFYVYTGDIQSRHAFFATLFMEVMQDPATQAWIRNRKHQGGVNTARQADDYAGDAVFSDVVTHAGDQRSPGLRLERWFRCHLSGDRSVGAQVDP